ncbi:hypothetical protein [Tessaracoccus sp. ZS01]|uniref:hypothetical protein n=1 Tax=Tessaracoccus sp. ZS01 TaxID=1906324 RepID=UPI001181483C|nr:hypothetical protein [Tessaracoccus sp. ZS01]
MVASEVYQAPAAMWWLPALLMLGGLAAVGISQRRGTSTDNDGAAPQVCSATPLTARAAVEAHLTERVRAAGWWRI